jgi:hypothetical protein
MKGIALILCAFVAVGAFAADTAIKGYLVDIACSREDGSKPGFGSKHTKDCLQMPDCAQSGYGVLTDDNKFLRFDKAGNDQAKKFITDLKKESDIKVTVTGTVNGNTMTVSKIELQ